MKKLTLVKARIKLGKSSLFTDFPVKYNSNLYDDLKKAHVQTKEVISENYVNWPEFLLEKFSFHFRSKLNTKIYDVAQNLLKIEYFISFVLVISMNYMERTWNTGN